MIIDDLFEASQSCPHCGGPMFSEMLMMEKKDACYYKVKASAKVWPSAYASGRLVQCRKKGAGNYGNKSEGVMEMDKSQTPPGRDGSNDEGGKKEYTAKATTAKKVAKDAEKILNKELNKKQGVAEATGDQKFDSMMGQITGGATARQSVDSLNKSLTARTGSDPETALAKWGQEFINWLEKICRNFERQGVDRFNKLEKVGNLDDGGETMAHWLIEVAKQSNTSGITQADIQEFSSEFNTQTGTSYTLVIGDLSDIVTLNNAAAITLTVPPSVFSANDQIHIVQYGAGQVTFAQGAGVTILSTGATTTAPKLRTNKSAATVICTASNTFLIVGDIV